ncbi:MAG: helix-turn-helix domain-containing protein [Gemmatimonadaceae bacterium]
MLRMLDRHAVQAMLAAGDRPRRIAAHFGISIRTVWRIAREPAITAGDARAARRARRVGRPAVAADVPTLVREWLTTEPDLPPETRQLYRVNCQTVRVTWGLRLRHLRQPYPTHG